MNIDTIQLNTKFNKEKIRRDNDCRVKMTVLRLKVSSRIGGASWYKLRREHI